LPYPTVAIYDTNNTDYFFFTAIELLGTTGLL